MVEEVRRQFNTIEGLMEGTARPDYVRCVEISTQARAAALSAQPRPALRPHPASSALGLGPALDCIQQRLAPK